MHEKALDADVPLLDISGFAGREPERFGIASELQPLFAADNHTGNDPDKIRHDYVHTSHRDWEDADEEHRWLAHRAESDGVRDIYYNDLDDAAVPETAASGQQDDMEFMGP